MSSVFKIRLISPWMEDLRVGDALFSRHIPAEEADALLCDWAPSPELFTFPRRKAWYNCEPRRHFGTLEGGTWPAIRRRLKPEEFLYHAHADPRYRVPHITHHGPLTMNRNLNRLDRAVAVVSGYGGSPRQRDADIRFRNRFILNPLVDLYGRSEGWRKYKAHVFARPRIPPNFKGDIPGDWDAAEKRQLLARYKVCVCVENSFEPHYFTEKFVDAVQAGCIPVYRAHPTVAETLLHGARWIDPSDWRGRPDQSISAALSARFEDYQEVNAAWLRESTQLRQTGGQVGFERIGAILAGE